MSTCLLSQYVNDILLGWADNIRDAKLLRQFEAFRQSLDTHDSRTHRLAQECYSQTDRAETSDKHNISPGYISTQTGCVGGPAPAGDHRTIQVTQFVRKRYQGTLFSQQKVGVSSVSLPPIGGTLGAGATNHPAPTTIMAQAAASDVIDDHSLALLKASHAGANALNDATRLMTANNPLVRFGACSPVAGSIDGTQITAAERRRLHADQHLAVSRLWNGKLP